jgi:ATP-independent RNA helicase DbpA
LEKLEISQRRVQALVLCPTRELCAQVLGEIRKFGRRSENLRVLALSGGQPVHAQIEALRRGVHIAVGTPGRVVDLIERSALDLAALRSIVLDEADRMLEMGFRTELEKIMAALPRSRQSVLFSATFPESIELISRKFQTNPVRISIHDEANTQALIAQACLELGRSEDKVQALQKLLRTERPERAIVFCNFKIGVTELAASLAAAGLSAEGLQGDLEQAERDRIMAKFRNASLRVLVSTDVAGRGIDVNDLDLVVNYDLPQNPEDYVHRVGRTGRAGKNGLAVSLVDPGDRRALRDLEAYLNFRMEPFTFKAIEADEAYGAYGEAPMRTLFIGGGRKQKIRPGDILGALTGEAGGLGAEDVGKIEIHDHFAYVAVARALAAEALEKLRAGRIKGRKIRVESVR